MPPAISFQLVFLFVVLAMQLSIVHIYLGAAYAKSYEICARASHKLSGGSVEKRENGVCGLSRVGNFPLESPMKTLLKSAGSFALRLSANALDTGRRIIKFVQDDSLIRNSEHTAI